MRLTTLLSATPGRRRRAYSRGRVATPGGRRRAYSGGRVATPGGRRRAYSRGRVATPGGRRRVVAVGSFRLTFANKTLQVAHAPKELDDVLFCVRSECANQR